MIIFVYAEIFLRNEIANNYIKKYMIMMKKIFIALTVLIVVVS